jgi:ribosomal protein S18 acetylase RimI-like enzyme
MRIVAVGGQARDEADNQDRDRARLVALRQVAGWDADRVDEWLADVAAGRRVVWIAERDGADVGMVALVLVADDPEVADGARSACVTSLVVLSSERRRGLGRVLTEHVETEARRRGFVTLTLYTGVDNPGALGLYRGLGYTSWKEADRDWGRAVFLRKLL